MELMLDPSAGTHVLGSNFGKLLTTYRDREGDNFCHATAGILRYTGHWLLLQCDDEIARYYAAEVQRRLGIKLHYKSQWGAHVSVIRGEKLLKNETKWGWHEGKEVRIKYTHDIYTNGQHWWLNVECDALAKVRGFYGFGTKKRWFHLTIGRL